MVSDEGFHRGLTAILSADAAEYSRLMGQDEGATVRILTAYRKVMTELVIGHGGRVVDAPGDNLLAEFPSVVAAVYCAVDIQEALKARNQELDPERRLFFRIGINLGDVIRQGQSIYGDGVNIAARLESLAKPGGICISGSVHDQVESKIPFTFEYKGEKYVKNIAKPVKVYTVRLSDRPDTADVKPRFWRWAFATVLILAAGITAGLMIWRTIPDQNLSKEVGATKPHQKPSLVVLPFANMTGDPNQEHFADGLTEQIITTLAKVPYLAVVARNSAFAYKGKSIKVQQVGSELGVRYVLEGSVQKTGARLRITVQLIEAKTGVHLWAKRYDMTQKNIFDLQDIIALNVLRSLEITLVSGEQARQYGKAKKLKAHEKCYEGVKYLNRFNRENNVLALQSFEEALKHDPEYSGLLYNLAWAHLLDARLGWSTSRERSLGKAEKFIKKALNTKPIRPAAYAILGLIELQRARYEKALILANRAIGMNPSGANAFAMSAPIFNSLGKSRKAVSLVEKAINLSPLPRSYYFHHLGDAYRIIGDYPKAITAYQKAIYRAPSFLEAQLGLTATYSLMGRIKEARAAAQQVLKIEPSFSLIRYAKGLVFRDKAKVKATTEALRQAGLK